MLPFTGGSYCWDFGYWPLPIQQARHGGLVPLTGCRLKLATNSRWLNWIRWRPQLIETSVVPLAGGLRHFGLGCRRIMDRSSVIKIHRKASHTCSRKTDWKVRRRDFEIQSELTLNNFVLGNLPDAVGKTVVKSAKANFWHFGNLGGKVPNRVDRSW